MSITAFILIVVTHVYGGTVVTMQEFSSEARCDVAAGVINNKHDSDIEYVQCVPK